MDCDDVMLLVAVGVHSRTLSGSEEEQLHEHLAGCDACRALTHDTEHDRPRRIARSSTETASAPDLTGLPAADPERFARGDVLARGGMSRVTRAHALAPASPVGNPEAVRDCLARYGGLVWSIARRFEDSGAEDAVQEIFRDLCRSVARYDPALPPSPRWSP